MNVFTLAGSRRGRIGLAAATALALLVGVGLPRLTSAQAAAPTIDVNQQDVNHNVDASEGLSGTNSVSVTFKLSADNAAPVSVKYATQDGSVFDDNAPKAVAGADYVAQNGTVDFPAHTTTKTVTFSVKGDNSDENNELFSIVLNSPTGGYVAGSNGTVTILDDDQPPAVSVDDATNDEGNDPACATPDPPTCKTILFHVALSAPLGRDAKVHAKTKDARAVGGPIPPAVTPPQATAGTDFVAIDADYPIPAGAPGIDIPVTVKGDSKDEADEKFELQLSTASGETLTATDFGTGTIKDDDASPVVSVAGDVQSDEGNDNLCGTTNHPACNTITLHVTLSAPSDKTVKVDYATADRSANSTSNTSPDYTGVSGSGNSALTFVPGDTDESVTVTIKGDATAEPDERFAFGIGNPQNATLGDVQSFGIIKNDDGGNFPNVSVSDAADVTESASATNSSFNVTASWPLGNTQDITVFYTTEDGPENGGCGTAVAGTDYTKTNGQITLQWQPSMTRTMPVTVPIKNDSVHEADECFQLQVTDVANANVTDPVGQAKIKDDDAAPTLSIDPATSVAEGTGNSATKAAVRVSLSAPSGDTVSVAYSTPQPNGGTATVDGPNADYANAQGNLVFAPGQTEKTFNVDVTADALDEPDETVAVAINNAQGAAISNGTGTLTITDDDAAPTISIDDAQVSEGDSGNATATFAVNLSAPSGRTITVHVATADGTAKAGEDYTTKAQDLTFTPGGPTEKDFQVLVTGDTKDEPDEAFTATLSAPTNSTIASGHDTGTATIQDDDAAPTVTVDSPPAVQENAGKVTFTLSLSPANSQQNVTVHVKTANGTATAPADYTAVDKDVVIPAGSASATVDVPVINDSTHESDENFTLALSNPTNATVSDTNGTGTATITDDDQGPPPPGAPDVSVGNATASEGDNATFTFTLTEAADSDVVVNYSTANGTATAPGDYTAATGATATIPAGDTTKTVNIATTEDTTHEPQETFTLTINSATNANVDQAHKTGTGTINDDDAAATHAQITTGAGPGGGPHIQSFVTNSPNAVTAFMDGTETTGKRVARGDLDGDGVDEIITGSGPNSAAVVSVYSSTGQLKASSFAYAGGRFYGGVFVAAGDIDGDGKAEVITGAGPGGGPHVIVWKLAGQQLTPVDGGFFAYSGDWHGGVTVAAGDTTGDGKDEIITGPGAGGGPDVEVTTGTKGEGRTRLLGFMAYVTPDNKPNWNGGVNVAAGDVDGDGKAEIAVVPWNGGGPHLRLFNPDASLHNNNGGIFVGPSNFPGGLTVGMGDLSGDGKAEIVVGVWTGSNRVKAYTGDLQPIPSLDFAPYGEFKGGNFVAVGQA